VTADRIDVTPEPMPAEREAIRRALEALGLVEPAPPGGGPEAGSDTASGGGSDP
jgi:hypothetical protein